MSTSSAYFREYELIQAKIDKIGEFKFRVRGWSLTLLSAGIAGCLSGKIAVEFLCLSLLPIYFFQLLEQRQSALSEALGERAKRIEKLLQLQSQPKSDAIASAKRKVLLESIVGTPRIASTLTTSERLSSSMFWRMWRPGAAHFYYFEYAMVILAWIMFLLTSPGETQPILAEPAEHAEITHARTQESFKSQSEELSLPKAEEIGRVREAMIILASEIETDDDSSMLKMWRDNLANAIGGAFPECTLMVENSCSLAAIISEMAPGNAELISRAERFEELANDVSSSGYTAPDHHQRLAQAVRDLEESVEEYLDALEGIED